ncbi:MAG TPA: hypothetical protein VHJ78_08160 [Actinomycetota bacterium]|nr:hypothetical protein [Actinomycetota bacterium]
MAGIALSGYRLGHSPRALRQFAAGRVCAEPGCTTTLSVYNGQDKCSIHKHPTKPPRNRGRRMVTYETAKGGEVR